MKKSQRNNQSQDDGQLGTVDLTAIPKINLGELDELLNGFVELKKPFLKDININILNPPTAVDVPGSPPEPVFDSKKQKDIQGNILPGFMKDHQQFLFYRIGNKRRAKKFLTWLVPLLTSMEEAVAFRKLYRARRLKLGKHRTFLCSTWVNIAFSYEGIAKLRNRREADSFGDRAFHEGLARRSTYLGDPAQKRARGHASNWMIGQPKKEADIIVIVAADSPRMMEDMSDAIKNEAAAQDLTLLYSQRGDTLPMPLRGHEHFGFRDGVSQPGVRGKLSATPGDYLTPRYIDHADDRRLYFSKPGQQLVWPGQFLLGEQRQDTEHLYNAAPTAASNFPQWAACGSYLVVRRLHQDVRLFWTFVAKAAASIGIPATRFASMMVGRWPSGAPLMRVPGADSPALGADEFANNHFLFDDDTRPSNLRPISGYPGDSFPQAAADFLATVCPHFAHIRKVNPRESVTDLGKPEDNASHMILRRGIPYGPALVGTKRISTRLANQDRGLMFLCYGATIEDQFEFLQRRWANSPVQPNLGGHDPVIGQNGETASRVRFIDFPKPGGGTNRIKYKEEWVIPTGGGYFFAPTIGAVKNFLAV